MNNSLLTLLEWVRGLTEDHAPDGWPPVRMAQLTALADEIERLRAEVETRRRCDEAMQHTMSDYLAECDAWRKRFPTYAYRALDGCVELRLNVVLTGP